MPLAVIFCSLLVFCPTMEAFYAEQPADAASAAAQRSKVLQGAVEQLYAADCALQDAIDKAHYMMGPAGHVTLAADVEVRGRCAPLHRDACWLRGVCESAVLFARDKHRRAAFFPFLQDIVAYAHKISKVRAGISLAPGVPVAA